MRPFQDVLDVLIPKINQLLKQAKDPEKLFALQREAIDLASITKGKPIDYNNAEATINLYENVEILDEEYEALAKKIFEFSESSPTRPQ